jgi:hypothetical protein
MNEAERAALDAVQTLRGTDRSGVMITSFEMVDAALRAFFQKVPCRNENEPYLSQSDSVLKQLKAAYK